MLLFGRTQGWEGFVVTSLRKSGMGLWRVISKRSWKTNITWPKYNNHSFLRFYIGVPLTMWEKMVLSWFVFFLAYITRGVYTDNFMLVSILICFALSLPRLLFTSCFPSEFHATSESESEKKGFRWFTNTFDFSHSMIITGLDYSVTVGKTTNQKFIFAAKIK